MFAESKNSRARAPRRRRKSNPATDASLPAHLAQERLLFDKKETAFILGIGSWKVEKLFYAGVLRGVRIGKRVLFHRDVVAEFARRGTR